MTDRPGKPEPLNLVDQATLWLAGPVRANRADFLMFLGGLLMVGVLWTLARQLGREEGHIEAARLSARIRDSTEAWEERGRRKFRDDVEEAVRAALQTERLHTGAQVPHA
jgi:hypothetical protein